MTVRKLLRSWLGALIILAAYYVVVNSTAIFVSHNAGELVSYVAAGVLTWWAGSSLQTKPAHRRH
jgi:hypothetical protein